MSGLSYSGISCSCKKKKKKNACSGRVRFNVLGVGAQTAAVCSIYIKEKNRKEKNI
jgi:hypothetical protein